METPEAGGGGGDRGGCTCAQSIQPDPHNSVLFTLPRSDPDGDRQQLSDGHWKPSQGEAELGTSCADHRLGGGGCAHLRDILLGGSPGNAPFRFGDVGGDPPYGEYPEGFPPPSGAVDHRENTPMKR